MKDSHSWIDFQGKYVVVTGATSGIGRAICLELNRLNARLVIAGRDMEKLNALYTELENEAHQILCLDLNSHEDISGQIRGISKRVGRLYGLCHSAGIVETRPLTSMNAERLNSILDVNLIAGIDFAKAVSKRDVMEEEGGSILFISSIYALIGMAGEIGYSASKGALISAARAMAIELARRRIRVNTLSPGLVRTAMTESAFSLMSRKRWDDLVDAHPLGAGTPEDVARAAVFLLSPQSSWITGTNLVIDGGYTAR